MSVDSLPWTDLSISTVHIKLPGLYGTIHTHHTHAHVISKGGNTKIKERAGSVLSWLRDYFQYARNISPFSDS